ncbi:CheY-like protein [Dioscorea alata]|uniref:CheY-like protein n=1 Tax=Dioscorea alata TaxID=55571 RepID=A0ACB7UQC1_DIOAL|nr:CheY-like protein [Dioscorea alata]
MVVESNSLYLFLIQQLLCQCDYKVTSCKQVQEAISFVLENQQSIDLIISDAFLPSEDGLLILETIALKFGIPVVIMSWNGETSTLMKFIAYGACDYLVKPVTLKELKNIWTHVFRKQIGDQMKYLLEIRIKHNNNNNNVLEPVEETKL